MKFLSKILFALILFLVVSCVTERAELIIINKSSEMISVLQIELYKSKETIKDFNVGEVMRFTFDSFTDAHYKVVGKYSSGKSIDIEFGYVTGGINVTDTLIIYDDSKFYHASDFK